MASKPTAPKGRATPKRPSIRKEATTSASSYWVQWLILAAVIVAIVVAIIVLQDPTPVNHSDRPSGF